MLPSIMPALYQSRSERDTGPAQEGVGAVREPPLLDSRFVRKYHFHSFAGDPPQAGHGKFRGNDKLAAHECLGNVKVPGEPEEVFLKGG